MDANQEAVLLACAACDSKREGDDHNEDSSEEESELEDEDRCGSAQSLGAWAIHNSQRGWRDPLKCSWDQALQSRIELSCRLGSAAGFGTEAAAVGCVVVAPVVNVTAEQDVQQVHATLEYGSTFHVSSCCPQLDPGSAVVAWQEADARGMVPCSECAGRDNETQQQREQQTVMLAAGKGKCFHTNELCPTLQWGHRLCSKLEARTRMKYKCSHCAHQDVEPT